MRIDPNMGMIFIAEETSPNQNYVKDMNVIDKSGIFFVEFFTCLHSFDVMNRNSRLYKAENVEECLKTERIQSYLRHGGWYGEMNHPTPEYKDRPLSPERIQDICMSNTSHRMLNPHVEENLLVSKMQTDAGTEAGMNLAKKMVQGFVPGFSCRAIASMELKDGKPTVKCRKIITYDWVLFQSHREAEQLKDRATEFISKTANTVKSITEKVGNTARDVMVPLKEILESVGKRDVNTQMIMESFDLNLNDITDITPDHKQLVIKDKNNMIYCNMSNESRKRVNDCLRQLW